QGCTFKHYCAICVEASLVDCVADTGGMTKKDFPRGVSQALGKFWVSGDNESKRLPGLCRIEGASVVVEVTDPLTVTSKSGGTAYAPLDDVDSFDLQGSLATNPSKVSFLGAYVAYRETTYR